MAFFIAINKIVKTKKGNDVMNRKLKVIHSLKMAMYLVREGFDIIKVADSFNDKELKVFLFEDSEELTEKMIEFNK